MTWIRSGTAVLLCACAAGCYARSELPLPEVHAVLPHVGAAEYPTEIEIRGRNFLAVVEGFPASARTELRDRFVVSLEGLELGPVTHVSATSLRTVVPAGLPAASYGITVVTPAGEQAHLTAAFEVRDLLAEEPRLDDGGDHGDREPGEPLGGDPQDPPPTAAPQLLLEDPLADAASSLLVATFGGQLWLGPDLEGRAAVRAADPQALWSHVGFAFARDAVGNIGRNATPGVPPAIGKKLCTPNTPGCGPDNEDGADLLGSMQLEGAEWLVLGGRRTHGDLSYLYMAGADTDPLALCYLDLSDLLGQQTLSVSALHTHRDRAYVGFLAKGGERPMLLVLFKAPAGPGLDAVSNGRDACDPAVHDACTLAAEALPALGKSSPVALIDTIADFNERLYVANNGGVVRSTTDSPLDARHYPGHWVDSTPSSDAFTELTSVVTTKDSEISPADRAVPSMAVFGNALLMARNTTSGPQLWRCVPGRVIGPAPATAADCDPGDWELLLAGAGGLSQFGNSHNMRMTLLATNGPYLYVGFDNAADGAVLFRTSDPNFSRPADFEGRDGCSAHLHPTACEGLGGNGLGDASNTRLLGQARLAQESQHWIYFVVSGELGPVRLYGQRD